MKLFLLLLMTALFAVITKVGFGQGENQEQLEEALTKVNADTSEIKIRLKLFWFLELNDREAAKAQLDTVSRMLADRDLKFLEGELNRSYGVYYSSAGLFSLAENYFIKSKQLYVEADNSIGEIACLNELAILDAQRGDFAGAQEKYLEVLDYFSKENKESRMADTYINIGNVNTYLGQFETALDYFDKGQTIHEKDKNDRGLMHVHSKRSFAYFSMGNNEEAIKSARLSLKYAKKVGDVIEQAVGEQSIGEYYSRQDQRDSALIHLNLSLDLFEELGLQPKVASVKLNIGAAELKYGNFDEALEAALESVAIAKKIDDQWVLMDAYLLLTDVYEYAGDSKNALSYYKLSTEINEKLKNEDVLNRVNELELAYETAEKENENRILREEDVNNKLRISRLTYQLIGLGILVLAIIILIIVVSRNRKSKARLIQTQLKQKALRAQMNPHFIFNSLNSIQRMYIEGREDIASDYMGDFADLLRIILENSGKSTISLKDEIDTLKLYLDLEILRTNDKLSYTLDIDNSIDLNNTQIPPLILQPFAENALWHGILPKGTKGTIQIDLRMKSDKFITCLIEDDGIGLVKSLESKKGRGHESKGISITQERLGGESAVRIEEIPEGGTRVEILIPVSK